MGNTQVRCRSSHTIAWISGNIRCVPLSRSPDLWNGGREIFLPFACIAFRYDVSVFEMRLLLHVWKIRNASNNSSSWIDLRRELSTLYGKFYAGFFGGAFLIYMQNLNIFVLLLSSYWLPQILWNLYSNSGNPSYQIIRSNHL